MVGVGAVVVRDGRVLIVCRAHEPWQGEWTLPGGHLHLGESLFDAVRREVKEETGREAHPAAIVEMFERVHRDPHGRVRYHFVVVDFVCESPSGEAVALSDAEAVAWVTAAELDAYGVNPHAVAIVAKGLELLDRQPGRVATTGL